MANLKIVDDNNFDAEITQYSGVAIVDFFAEWCGPCRFLSPIFEKLSKEYEGDDVKFVKLDVDSARVTAGKFGIRAVPTVIIFKNGAEVERMLGVQPEPEIKAKVDRHR